MAQAPHDPMPVGPPTWPAPELPQTPTPSRAPMICAIAIALIALAVAIGSWFRPIQEPSTPPAKVYSAQEVADAKTAVCGAFEKVSRGVQTAGTRTGQDYPDATLAVAVNVRLSMSSGSAYLMQEIQDNPAAPNDLSAAVSDLANAYQQIAISQLGEVPKSELRPLFESGDHASADTKRMCQ